MNCPHAQLTCMYAQTHKFKGKCIVYTTRDVTNETIETRNNFTEAYPTSLLANRLKPQDPILPHKGTKYIRLFHIP